MTGEITNTQILALSQDGVNAEGISADLGVPVEQVKLVLAAHKAGSIEDRDITDRDLAVIRKNLVYLAINADDQAVQARVGMYLVDRDKPKAPADYGSGITAINNAIIIAQQSYDKLMKEYAEE